MALHQSFSAFGLIPSPVSASKLLITQQFIVPELLVSGPTNSNCTPADTNLKLV
nr:hypothetical protein [Cressdnaviricota sp.]